MGDKIKRTADNAAIDHRFGDWQLKEWKTPRCHCGALATVEVNKRGSVAFYCTPHLPVDALGDHKR